ncbi:MAG: class I SAM-dependent methyltransferase [Flavisolibacter sp.]
MKAATHQLQSNSSLAEDPQFGELYFTLRSREKRIYTDEEVSLLPFTNKTHRYHREWGLRNFSSQRLLRFLKKKKKPMDVLEIGCGNGWLSAQMAKLLGTSVTGWDVHQPELDQAKRVFGSISNLYFEYHNFQSEETGDEKYDLIVFAASIQYFSSLQVAINKTMKLLKAGGEIHLIDTHLYRAEELEQARLRTENYFRSIEMEAMKHFYYQHSLKDLDGFNYSILYDPLSLVNRLLKRGPFYWICIKNKI